MILTKTIISQYHCQVVQVPQAQIIQPQQPPVSVGQLVPGQATISAGQLVQGQSASPGHILQQPMGQIALGSDHIIQLRVTHINTFQCLLP